MERITCDMCTYIARTPSILVKHVLMYHQNDPLFKIGCKFESCHATFRKWDSFRKHVYRNHPNQNLDEIQHLRQNCNDPDVENDVNAENGVNNRLLQIIQQQRWQSASFLLNVRETCKTSQVALDTIMNGVANLTKVYSKTAIDHLRRLADPVTNLVNLDDVEDILLNNATRANIFAGVDTKFLLDKFLVEECNMVFPKKIVLGYTPTWNYRKPIPELKLVEDRAYYVPLLDELKVLLSNQEILDEVLHPEPTDEDVYRTVTDGSFYKMLFDIDQKHRLVIIFYFDELVITNQVGATAKKHKSSMFYWTIGNINPKYRSNLNAIQLYAIAKTSHVKKHGLHVILQPFISDIRKLENDGLTIRARNGENIVLKGSLLFVAGDTPASAAIGGFKESVAAFRLCRSCLTTCEDWRRTFKDNNFPPRDKVSHRRHCEAITEPNLTEQTRRFWKRFYGINSISPISDICDVTQCLPQDIMHVMLEGVCEVMIRTYLRYLVQDQQLFDIDDLNDRINSFDFNCFSDNKPAPISVEHLNRDNNLKQTASQMFNLLHTLPFLLSDLVEDEIEEIYVACYTLLLQITNMCFAYEIHRNSVDILQRMIEIFCLRFTHLFPGAIVPKFHFLIHVVRYILLFGPLRQQSCTRFEALHAFFRSTARVVRSFKNISYTLSYRHQAQLTSRLASCEGAPDKKFLYQGDDIKPDDVILLNNLPDPELLYPFVNENDRMTMRIMRSPEVKRNEVIYKRNCVIALNIYDTCPPTFGLVKDIFVLTNVIILSYQILDTNYFDARLNAYNVLLPNNAVKRVISLNNLIFPHEIPVFYCNGNMYVLLLNHEYTEFYG